MLDALFNPRSIAVIGASNNPLSIGYIVIKNLLDHGFKGPIYPINPKAKFIQCFPAYSSIMDVPDEVDLVNISIKNTLVPQALEECGKKGVKFAIVHTAGFKEVGEEGRALEKQIVEVAHKHGMRVYGPNSQGIQNSDEKVSVYANFTFVPMVPSNLSIVAQSGGVGEVFKLHLWEIGLGIRMYASFGNEADVKMNEIIEHYGKDEGTRAIMVHIETLSDPVGFLKVAGAITPKKPILALKTGRTKEGLVAVSSHTGTLVEADTTTDVIFQKAGVMRFPSQEELIRAAIAFSGQPVPKGNRVAIITNTGGPAIIAVDECITAGLKLAELKDETKALLRKSLHAEATVKNPVDVVATAGPDHYAITIDSLLKDPNVDSLLINFVTAPFVDLEGIASRIAEFGPKAEKPIVCVVMTIEKWAGLIRKIRASGIPVYEYPESAARALVAMTQYGAIQKRETPAYVTFDADKKKAEAILNKVKEGFLSQQDAFELLRCYGIPAAATARVTSAEDLKGAADKVGFPLVLKVDAESIVHKTEAGGLHLNIGDFDQLREAFARMQERFKGIRPAFIVQEFLAGGREVIVGAKRSVGAGHVIMFGLGGIFVEVMKDVAFRLAPLSRQDAREMVRSIQGRPILEGFRGNPGVDIDAIEKILLRVSQMVSDLPAVSELDLNPVVAFEKGKGASVLDVRMKVGK